LEAWPAALVEKNAGQNRFFANISETIHCQKLMFISKIKIPRSLVFYEPRTINNSRDRFFKDFLFSLRKFVFFFCAFFANIKFGCFYKTYRTKSKEYSNRVTYKMDLYWIVWPIVT